VLGFAVTRVLGGEAHLVDVLVLPGEGNVAEALIRDSMGLATRQGALWLRCRLPQRHPYVHALERAGFVDLGALAGELIDPRDTDPAVFEFLDQEDVRVHLTYGDSDHV
jgi:hypothetical protein